MRNILLIAVLIGTVGCTGSKTVIEDRELTVPGSHKDTSTVVSHPPQADGYLYGPEPCPPCDTLTIRATAPPETTGYTSGGIDLSVIRRPYMRTIALLKDSLGRVTQRVAQLAANYQFRVDEAARTVGYRDTTRLGATERHTWRDWLSAGVVGAVVLIALALVGWLLVKRMMPPVTF